MKKIYLIREKHTPYGGAENYLQRFKDAAKKYPNFSFHTINSPFPLFLPSWLRVILFNAFLRLTKGNRFYFSMDRITCPDVYRAGDGVHKIFLTKIRKSSFNPLHSVLLHLEKRCFENASKIIANSQMVRDQIVENFNVRKEKVVVVYNGVDKDRDVMHIPKKKLFKKFSIPLHHKVILFVGNGFERKGLASFLKIIQLVANENISALIVGADKNTKKYKKIAQELEISNIVYFLGERKDVSEIYRLSEIVILPTYYDPFSNVVIEALHYGNVVITTRQNGASEIIDKSLQMDNPNDTSIARKINSLLQNNNEMKKIQRANMIKARRFSIDRNVSATLSEIEKILS